MEISKERLQELEDMGSKMHALEAGGVDNWNYYDDALEEYRKERDLRESREEFREKAEELHEEVEMEIANNQYEPSERGAGTATRDKTQQDVVEMIIDFAIDIKKKYE